MTLPQSMLALTIVCQIALIQGVALAHPNPQLEVRNENHYSSDCWKTVTCTQTVTKTSTQTITQCKPTSTPPPKTTSTSPPKTTSTSPPKTTSTPTSPVPSGGCLLVTCPASGYSLDYYANPFLGYGYVHGGKDGNYYLDLKQTPLASSTSEITYFPHDNGPGPNAPAIFPNSSVYAAYYPTYTRSFDGITVNGNNFTLVYQGFYKAPSTGNFTFCTAADNINTVYFGSDAAFSCAGKASSGTSASVVGFIQNDYMNPTACFSQELVASVYYPIRLVMGNYNSASAFGFTVTPPGGSASYNFTGSVYPHTCGLGV